MVERTNAGGGPRQTALPGRPAPSGPIQSGPIQSGPIQSGPIQSGPIQSGPIDPELGARIEAWMAADPDPTTRLELRRLLDSGDVAAISDRFAGLLRFGTAGLRAPLGTGPARMNRLVVRLAAGGLARFLTAAGSAGERAGGIVTVVVGHDARSRSDDFALDTARVFAGTGVRSVLLGLVPTPTLAFAVRHLGADAGVMCTASHNPVGDNGYKVYLGEGAQIIPPCDEQIAAAMAEVAEETESGQTLALAPDDDPLVVHAGEEVRLAYVEHVLGVLEALDGAGRDRSRLSIVYTPLHGVGGSLMLDAFGRAGFSDVRVVEKQFEPDGSFPTTPFPNPEEPGALDLAIGLAVPGVGPPGLRGKVADLVLANDPDADRLGVMVPTRGGEGVVALTGDQIGALLAAFVLDRTEVLGPARLVVSTFVSSELLRSMAAARGVHFAETPTGFKWVVRPALAHPDQAYVFGYEEALGFSVDAYVRDKDGISAALVMAALVATLRSEGHTVWDVLDDLARVHGCHVTRTWQVRLAEEDGRHRIASAMSHLRSDPPAVLAGRRVTEVVDLLSPGAPGQGPGFPPTDAVILRIEGGARIVARPSGTEPKLKFYFEVVAPVPAGARVAAVEAAAAAGVDALQAAVGAEMGMI